MLGHSAYMKMLALWVKWFAIYQKSEGFFGHLRGFNHRFGYVFK